MADVGPCRVAALPLNYATVDRRRDRLPPFLQWKTLGLIACYLVLTQAANLVRVETRRTALESAGKGVFLVALFPASLLFERAMSAVQGQEAVIVVFNLVLVVQSVGYPYAVACLWDRRQRRPGHDAP